MKEENRMMQDEMMNEEEIIGKEIEKELENTPEKLATYRIYYGWQPALGKKTRSAGCCRP